MTALRRNSVTLAWSILWTAFTIFCALVVAVPLGVRWYIGNATDSEPAELVVINGTVLVEEPGGGPPRGITSDASPVWISEHARIRTDSSARALLTFFKNTKDSWSTARLQGDSEVILVEVRRPRFDQSPQPYNLTLEVRGGNVGLGSPQPASRPLHFEVRTPQVQSIVLGAGSYQVEVDNGASNIVSYTSDALVTAASQKVILRRQERTRVNLNEPPQPPVPAARDLILNGDFTEPLDVGWRPFFDQGGDGGNLDGQYQLVVSGDRQAVHFFRTNTQGNSAIVGLRQIINKDLPDNITLLRLQAEVQVIFQSLAGGGYQSSEYPIILRIRYRDQFGNENEWYHGFYADSGNNTLYSERVPHNVWYLYNSPNLLEVMNPRPFHLLHLDVYASGWDYESLVSRVRLIVN
ncbi:MAG: hypothetical protein EXR62_12995 [Chloroflexi bacterium]|nr:hypothetical protein [Chloroflexota bacterium]